MDPVIEFAQETIRNCDRCHLHSQVKSPVPFQLVGKECDVAIIGEAPGANEDVEGIPFIGSSGSLLRNILNRIGASNYALMNVICCRPTKPTGENRVPGIYEIRACRVNYDLQLSVLNPKVLVLAGGTSLSLWRPDLQISKARGRVGLWGERYVYPVFHPRYIAGTVGENYNTFMEDLSKAFKLVNFSRAQLMPTLSDKCVECMRDVYTYDSDLVAWCRSHWRADLGSSRDFEQMSIL